MRWRDAFDTVFANFLRFGFRTRRMQVFWIFSLIPALIAGIITVIELSSADAGGAVRAVFFNSMLVFYFQLLLPVLALFFGSSIISDELDNRTLPYLTTSAAPKTAVFFGKFAAHYLTTALQLNAGLFLTYILTRFDSLGHWPAWQDWLQFAAISLLALLAYGAIFSFLGTLMRKSLMLGLFFVFGWESVVQYFPGSTQKFTVIHYIKSLLPALPREVKFLVFQLEPSSVPESLLTLLLLTAVFLAAAAILFQKKEFVVSDAA